MNGKAAKRIRYVAATVTPEKLRGKAFRQIYQKLRQEYKRNPYHRRASLIKFGIKVQPHKDAIKHRRAVWGISMRKFRRRLTKRLNSQ